MTYPILFGNPGQSGPLREWSQHLLRDQRCFTDHVALICEVASLQMFRTFTTQARAKWTGTEQLSNCNFIPITFCCRACEFLCPSSLNRSSFTLHAESELLQGLSTPKAYWQWVADKSDCRRVFFSQPRQRPSQFCWNPRPTESKLCCYHKLPRQITSGVASVE